MLFRSPKLEAAVEVRNGLASLYRARLGKLRGIHFQEISRGDRCSYTDFAVVIDPSTFGLTRDELALALKAENIETRTYYDPPVHLQRAYRQFASAHGLSQTEKLAANILCLPIWSAMEPAMVSRTCDAIEAAHQQADLVRARLTARELNFENSPRTGATSLQPSMVEA